MNNIISKLQNEPNKPNKPNEPIVNPIPKTLGIDYSTSIDINKDNMCIDDNLKKKHIINKIKLINNKSYLNNIFLFIKNNNIKYTLNNNGVFFNLNTLNTVKLGLLYNYINSIINNLDFFDNDDNNLQIIKDNIKKTHINSIKTTNSSYISLSLNEFTDFEKNVIKLSTLK